MVRRDRVRDRLKQHRLSGSWRSDDQAALTLTDWRQQIEHASRQVVLAVRCLQLQPLVWIERSQVVEKNLIPGFIRMLEVDGFDFDQSKVTLSVFRRPHLARHRIAGPQVEL